MGGQKKLRLSWRRDQMGCTVFLTVEWTASMEF